MYVNKQNRIRSIEWVDGDGLKLLDQRKLPHETCYLVCKSYRDVIAAIKNMTVRGAPAIAISGAYGVCLAFQEVGLEGLTSAIEEIGSARPTAVNLRFAVEAMRDVLKNSSERELKAALLKRANQLFDEDVQTNQAIARAGLALIPSGAHVIHHCNTGTLATADYGTALGVIRYAHEQGQWIHAFLDETRPRMQGASLSSYELAAFGVPHTVIVDSAAAYLMQVRKIDLCLVGCDQVAANGDVANKIGTYALALAAKAHRVPFYVACTASSIDRSASSGNDIEIEERSVDEVLSIGGVRIAPQGTNAWNPAFDITPHELISGFITERGVLLPPFSDSLNSLSLDR